MTDDIICPTCRGSGRVGIFGCEPCKGTGRGNAEVLANRAARARQRDFEWASAGAARAATDAGYAADLDAERAAQDAAREDD